MQKLKYLSFIISVFILTLVVGYSVFAGWQEAPPMPPEDDVAAPLNVGSNPQVKSGGLGVRSLVVFEEDGIGGDVEIDGNILAPNNTWGSCATLSWTCNASQTCPNGRFMTRVDRGTTRSLCGSGTTRWYQMRIRCCGI